MKLFGTLKGIATELLDLNDSKPYIKPVSEYAGRDENGYSVYNITSCNYESDACLSDGYTVEGPVSKALVRVGHNKWQLRGECNDTYVRK
mgnify:CR=1 FL=1